MKLNKMLGLAAIALVLFSGCKKDDAAVPAEVTINSDGTLNTNDGDGALYALEIRNYDSNTGSDYEPRQEAYAWFGKFPTFVNGGVVKVNDIELGNIFNYYFATEYLSIGDTLFTGTNANASWNIGGDASTGVTAFTHTDNSTLPPAPNFTLPASINTNSSLTVSHSATGGMGVLYTLAGDNGDTSKFVTNSSSSVTFTSAEIKSVAVSGGGAIGLSIMPVSYTTATYSGKKYYFVKQHQFTRETVTQ